MLHEVGKWRITSRSFLHGRTLWSQFQETLLCPLQRRTWRGGGLCHEASWLLDGSCCWCHWPTTRCHQYNNYWFCWESGRQSQRTFGSTHRLMQCIRGELCCSDTVPRGWWRWRGVDHLRVEGRYDIHSNNQILSSCCGVRNMLGGMGSGCGGSHMWCGGWGFESLLLAWFSILLGTHNHRMAPCLWFSHWNRLQDSKSNIFIEAGLYFLLPVE